MPVSSNEQVAGWQVQMRVPLATAAATATVTPPQWRSCSDKRQVKSSMSSLDAHLTLTMLVRDAIRTCCIRRLECRQFPHFSVQSPLPIPIPQPTSASPRPLAPAPPGRPRIRRRVIDGENATQELKKCLAHSAACKCGAVPMTWRQ